MTVLLFFKTKTTDRKKKNEQNFLHFVMIERGKWQLYKHSSSNTFCGQNNVLNLPSAPGAWRFAFIVFLISNAPGGWRQPICTNSKRITVQRELSSNQQAEIRRFTWLKDVTGIIHKTKLTAELCEQQQIVPVPSPSIHVHAFTDSVKLPEYSSQRG